MSRKEVLKALQQATVAAGTLTLSEFETGTATATDGLTEVARYDAGQTLSLRQDKPFVPVPVAFESFATDGTAGNSETFDLSHDLIDSGHTSESVVLWLDDGNGAARVQPDGVDYDAGTVTYTDDGTGNDLFVFYTAGDQARLVVRKVDPGGAPEDLIELDIGLLHRRDKLSDPLKFGFTRQLQPVVPRKFSLRLYVDVPYTCKFEHDAPSGTVTAKNAILNVPVRRARDRIEGLRRVVRHDMAEA